MKKILLVEDHPETVVLFHTHISGLEYALSVCSRGEDALKIAVQNYHDLIVVDHSLPDMQTPVLCQQLVSRKINSPILLLTGPSVNGAETAAACGADDWLAKPFTIRLLKAKVSKLIRRSDDQQRALTECG